MSATLADPSIFVDGGLRCWRPPGFFHSTSCRICKTSIIVRDKVAKRYQRASKDHLRNSRKTWGKAVHMVVHRTVDTNSQLDSDSHGMKDLWEEPSKMAHELERSKFRMCWNSSKRRSPQKSQPRWMVSISSDMLWRNRTQTLWNIYFKFTTPYIPGIMPGQLPQCYTLNSLDTFRQVAVQRVPSHNSNPESSRQTLPKWGAAVKQLWEAFHPIPASSGRSSSTVVGQMRNTPLSSLRIWGTTSHPTVSKCLENWKNEHTGYIMLDDI